MLEGGHAGQGVAVTVEFGAPDCDGEVAGDVGRYAAAHTALALRKRNALARSTHDMDMAH